MEKFRSEEGNEFIDAPEDFSSLGCGSECASTCSHNSYNAKSSFDESDFVADGLSYDFWAQEPMSIDERRGEFLRRTGLDLERFSSAREGPCETIPEDESVGTPEESSEDVALKVEEKDEEESATETSVDNSCISSPNAAKPESLASRTMSDAAVFQKSCKIDTANQSSNLEEIYKKLGIVNWVNQHFKRRELVDDGHLEFLKKKQRKEGWLKRLSFKGSFNFRSEGTSEGSEAHGGSAGVQTQSRRKEWKELSCLYKGQDFEGHTGHVLVMKFSLDGMHLATGGQDGGVRIWEVVQDEMSAELGDLVAERSCLYIPSTGSTNVDFNKKEDGNVMRKGKKMPEKVCIIAPKKFFRLVEKPLHDFCEHEGAVLDISWSENKYLLSASVDKTVRLWQLGHDHCVKVFAHHNFVTCVQFNPEDDDYFISGSIDGKVRVWSIPCRQVVHWIDIKEIITAITYHPSGKRAVAGTILGKCHFYEVKDNHLHLDTVLCIQGKRWSSGNRINSFQYSPVDPNKLIVTSGDSQVRITCGVGVVHKLKGLRGARMHMSASFTADGKYVVSASADSNVYIWNCSNASGTSFCYTNNEIKSFECFHSDNAVIAVPWHGYSATPHQPQQQPSVKDSDNLPNRLPDVASPSLSESDCMLLKDACQRMVHSDMWGLVIVTGSSDGQIRAYHNYGLPVRV